MYNIDAKDVLAKIHNFEVIRDDGFIPIKMYEFLMHHAKGKFMAFPDLPFHDVDANLGSYGSSLEEALDGCLNKIKGKSRDQIFTRVKTAK